MAVQDAADRSIKQGGSHMTRIFIQGTAFVLALLAGTAIAQAPHSHNHSFTDAEKWARSFDDPKRDAWQKPHEVIMALALAPDAVVADIGAGTGYFAVRLAHFVPKGRVYGVDTEPEMVKHLDQRAKKAGLDNLTALLGRADAPQLPEKIDLALLVDVYHHVADREAYFRKLREGLKPGGRVAIIDFNQTSRVGPPVKERISAAKVKDEMRAAGYRITEEPAILPNQYLLIFAVAPR
jgi:ubiquinone/menaquinone biosynthesis C-methylase UbiE